MDQLSLFDFNTIPQDNEHYVGETVLVNYDGIEYTGTVTRIYNNGDSLCVAFDEGRRSTAFYVENVKSY